MFPRYDEENLARYLDFVKIVELMVKDLEFLFSRKRNKDLNKKNLLINYLVFQYQFEEKMPKDVYKQVERLYNA